MSGVDRRIVPLLKSASEIENASRTSRSTCSSDQVGRAHVRDLRRNRGHGRNGATNRMHIGIHTYNALTRRPKAPGYPRAIDHATWKPVHASVTLALASSTYTWASSTACLPAENQLTCQRPEPFVYSYAVARGCRRSSATIVRLRAAIFSTFAAVRR